MAAVAAPLVQGSPSGSQGEGSQWEAEDGGGAWMMVGARGKIRTEELGRGEELQETEDVREEGVLMNQDVPKKSPDLSGLVRRLREGEQEQLKTSTPRRKFN